MVFCDTQGGQISNDPNALRSFGELRDTSGMMEGDDHVYDEYNDRNIHSDDACWIDSRGYYCHNDDAGYCNVNDEWFIHDDLVQLWDNRTVHEDEATYVTEQSSYALPDDVFTCEYSDNEYIEGYEGASSYFIEELNITVNYENIDEAYEAEGYECINGKWSLSESE